MQRAAWKVGYQQRQKGRRTDFRMVSEEGVTVVHSGII